jgi:thiol-disulfide isomerase/thioredoxin
MKIKMILVFLTVFLFSAVQAWSGAGSTSAPLSTPELKQAFSSGKKTVVFFINPFGKPCKEQDMILQKLHKDKNGDFNIAYVHSTKPENQQAFYDYGIRSLPSLVLVDKSGRISRHFPPGIQSYETLTQALDSIK